ncbi:MAG: hypothetical protein A2Z91_04790 [Deltaproteobacteria bacterium GWA2_38_16]|nr:MAG: hypothetical protein A2Z91_04790 [Deltaproteobacteria bacterium GWA2_38_16]OGQ02223.1 MAG: hypothetical protein A3D19_00355 [Deltaproteobacteria bacterium RIFCSPHIGHO2_02_FULL_38_15]
MKLKLTFNPVVIKKIIIILLAILIASITTSFSFNLKKAYGGTPEDILVKELMDKKAELEKLSAKLSEFIERSKTATPSADDMSVLVAELKRFQSLYPSRALDGLIEVLSDRKDTFDSALKSVLVNYLGTLIEDTTELDKKIKSYGGNTAKKPCDPTDPNSPCALKSDLLEQIAALQKVLEAKNQETTSLKEAVSELKKGNKDLTEKMGKIEKDMFETIVQLQTQITLSSSSPEQIVTQYHELSKKFMGLFQLVRSIKVSIGQMDERIEDIKEELTKTDLSSEKREKLEKELKSLTADRDKAQKTFDQLEKSFAMQKSMITAFRAHMEQNQIDPQLSGQGRGVRVIGPDGQVVMQQPPVATQPQGQNQGQMTQDEFIRNIVMQQVFGIQRSVNNFNQGISANMPPAQVQPAPGANPNRQAGNRGSSSISAGSNVPRGNSLMDLIQF